MSAPWNCSLPFAVGNRRGGPPLRTRGGPTLVQGRCNAAAEPLNDRPWTGLGPALHRPCLGKGPTNQRTKRRISSPESALAMQPRASEPVSAALGNRASSALRLAGAQEVGQSHTEPWLNVSFGSDAQRFYCGKAKQ